MLNVLLLLQVSSITIQADVLQLLRQVLATWLPRSEPIREVLLKLPHVNTQVTPGWATGAAGSAEFERQGMKQPSYARAQLQAKWVCAFRPQQAFCVSAVTPNTSSSKGCRALQPPCYPNFTLSPIVNYCQLSSTTGHYRQLLPVY